MIAVCAPVADFFAVKLGGNVDEKTQTGRKARAKRRAASQP
jgi:hypothetical protein